VHPERRAAHVGELHVGALEDEAGPPAGLIREATRRWRGAGEREPDFGTGG
jgi:hypothetical protein